MKTMANKNYRKALKLAAQFIEDREGDCPAGIMDAEIRNCEKECKSQSAECWEMFFLREAEIDDD
jgi:hypothetical protein